MYTEKRCLFAATHFTDATNDILSVCCLFVYLFIMQVVQLKVGQMWCHMWLNCNSGYLLDTSLWTFSSFLGM